MVQIHEQNLAAGENAKLQAMQHAVRCILMALGEDVTREGLMDTPKRVAKALMAMTDGYRQDPETLLSQALFNEPVIQAGAGGLVLVRDIDFAALSQATLLPFYGRAHIAYMPARGVVLGLSKLARLTKLCAKRLHSQRSLGLQLLHALQAALAPAGALVVLQARHLTYTGQQPPAQQLTAAASGCFAGKAQCLQAACGVATLEVAEVSSPASRGGPCLQEVLELLGLPVELQDVQLVPDAADPALLLQQPCCCCSGGGGSSSDSCTSCGGCGGSSRRLEPSILRGFSASAAAAGAAAAGGAGGSGGTDSPRAPVTPDPSENDDTDGSEPEFFGSNLGDNLLCCQQHHQQHQHQQHRHLLAMGDSHGSSAAATAVEAAGDAAAAAGATCSMEAALKLLLGESGVDVTSSAVETAVRRHVLALLAATSGYHQEQPSRPCSSWQQQQELEQQPGSASGGSSSGGCVWSSARPQQQQQQELEWHEHTVQFMSQCEHHMLPFHGTAHITYLLPSSGSSSPQQQQQPLSAAEARQLVCCFTRRLQVQERITAQVAAAVQQLLRPAGVMVVVRAVHMCMVARGVENHAGSTVTRAALGVFEREAGLRCRVLRALNSNSSSSSTGQDSGSLPQQKLLLQHSDRE